MTKAEHPCFSCALPDCDDRSRRCALRRALNTYDSYRRRGEPRPDDVKLLYNIAYDEIYAGARNLRRVESYRNSRASAARGGEA